MRHQNGHLPSKSRKNCRLQVIPMEYSQTWRGELFLLHQDNVAGILIFATDTDIRMLVRCAVIFMDGTFKTSPFPYLQFFTLHGELNSYVLKFACGLLADKSIASYTRVLQVNLLFSMTKKLTVIERSSNYTNKCH